MIKIFHNSRCKHSRAGLEYLKANNVEFDVREYLKEPLTKEDIKEILLKTNLPAKELVRTQEEYFKKSLKGKNFTNEEWVKILVENPKLLHRPIVVGKYKATIANPPEKADLIINH